MFKSLFTDWSLEKKCLFFLGLAPPFSLVLGAVAVQWVAERLVKESIRQSARDHADKVVWRKHIPVMTKQAGAASDPNSEAQLSIFDEKKPSSQYDSVLLKLNDGLEHLALGGTAARDDDEKILSKIQAKLSEFEAKARTEIQANPAIASTESLPKDLPLDWQLSGGPAQSVFEETGPIDGFHIFYQPVFFGDACRTCHMRNVDLSVPKTVAYSVDPFRVIKVRVPVKDTSYWRIWSYSLLSAIGIATLCCRFSSSIGF